jgi:DnaK suppressor protein
MNKRNLTYFKKQLEKEVQILSAGIDCNLDGLHRSETDAPDLIDRAAHLIDRSLSQHICDRKNSRLSKVERALEDLEAGLYGICQSCGEDIAVKRLKANPVARQCISCKTELETMERLTGGRWRQNDRATNGIQ